MDTIYLSDRDLAERYQASRATIWRWVSTRGLPHPIKFSPGCVRWKLNEVEAWEQTCQRSQLLADRETR